MAEKYKRHEVDAGVFAEMLPEGAKLYERHKTPLLEFRQNRIKYKMTDFQLLHPLGVEAFRMCLGEMMSDPDAEECRIEVSEGVDDDTVEIIIDIVMGFEYQAEKGGKNGFYIGSCVIPSMRCEEQDGKKTLVFKFNGEFSRCAYDYAHMHAGENITLAGLVIYAVEAHMKDMEENT